jgi:hypothetical protein
MDSKNDRYRVPVPDAIAADIVAQGLAQAMAAGALTRLEVPCIGEHGIKDDRLEAICCELGRGRCPSLRILSAPKNLMGDKGCEALARAMRAGHLPRLEGLFLRGSSDITNAGALALADALEAGAAPALKELDLESTVSIGDDGREALLGAAGACPLVEEEGVRVYREWKCILDLAPRVNWEINRLANLGLSVSSELFA